MRARPEIEKDHKGFDALILEVLLDIRDLLKKDEPAPLYVPDLKPEEPRSEVPVRVKRKRRTRKQMAAARRLKTE